MKQFAIYDSNTVTGEEFKGIVQTIFDDAHAEELVLFDAAYLPMLCIAGQGGKVIRWIRCIISYN